MFLQVQSTNRLFFIQGAVPRGNATSENIQRMGFREGQVRFEPSSWNLNCSIRPISVLDSLWWFYYCTESFQFSCSNFRWSSSAPSAAASSPNEPITVQFARGASGKWTITAHGKHFLLYKHAICHYWIGLINLIKFLAVHCISTALSINAAT